MDAFKRIILELERLQEDLPPGVLYSSLETAKDSLKPESTFSILKLLHRHQARCGLPVSIDRVCPASAVKIACSLEKRGGLLQWAGQTTTPVQLKSIDVKNLWLAKAMWTRECTTKVAACTADPALCTCHMDCKLAGHA